MGRTDPIRGPSARLPLQCVAFDLQTKLAADPRLTDDLGGCCGPTSLAHTLVLLLVPAEQPYLEGEFSAALIIDITTSYLHGEPLIGLEPGEEYTGDLLLHVYAISPPSGTTLVLNTTISASHSSLELALDLSLLQASSQAYDISCSARRVDAVDQTFSSSSALRYLPPNPFGGSTVKLDRRTGGLLVDEAGRWVPLLYTGFYTVFSDYVATTHLLDEMAQQGCVVRVS